MNIWKLKHWDSATSILHFGLAFCVTIQLISSQFLGDAHFVFIIHEIFGLATVAIVSLHCFLNFTGDKHRLKHAFPWNKKGWQEIKEDCRMLVKLQLPEGDSQRGGLSGLVHGLGLLAVLGMAFTGLLIFIWIQEGVNPHSIKHWHSFIANFIWVYWFGHVALAIVHRFKDRFGK
jgi:hypothetical protein